VLNIDNLAVDPHLARFVDELRLRLRTTAGSTGSTSSSVASELATPGSSSSTSSSTTTTPATLSRSSSVATVAAAAAEQQQQQAELEASLLATEELEEPATKYLLPRPVRLVTLCVYFRAKAAVVWANGACTIRHIHQVPGA
jgi:hypothetical protein